MEIGIVGGTGPAGRGLAARLAAVGHSVTMGSRSKYRALEECDKLLGTWPDLAGSVVAGDNASAATAELVVIATPWDAAASIARSVAPHLRGKVVVTMANALERVDQEFEPLIPPRGSVAGHVQAVVPEAKVVAAFQHVPAHELGNLHEPIQSDVLICSDHAPAIEVVSRLVREIPDLRPLDCGQLSNATAIEAFTAVLLQLNTRYRTRVALRITGLPDGLADQGA
ncbi:MAG TPA: NADPH-dependent F420 reductase [Acidimicrobiia bacterium]|nr:NADPH-dependent F420 reductase [Acidimicrobiia bacterium]